VAAGATQTKPCATNACPAACELSLPGNFDADGVWHNYLYTNCTRPCAGKVTFINQSDYSHPVADFL
jgi:hypothetical protein